MKIIGVGKWVWMLLLALDHLAVIAIEIITPALVSPGVNIHSEYIYMYSAQAVCAIVAICFVQNLAHRRNPTFRWYVAAMFGMGVVTVFRFTIGFSVNMGLLAALCFCCMLAVYRMLVVGEIGVKAIKFGTNSFVFWLVWIILGAESVLAWNLSGL